MLGRKVLHDFDPPKNYEPYIVCAAVLVEKDGKNVMLCGARHFDYVMLSQVNDMGGFDKQIEQGFIDKWGHFWSREDAMAQVKKNGQKFNQARNGHSDTTLFSEGLY